VILEFLTKIRRLSYIERCSNTLHIQRYSVAEHSFYTTLLAMIFADMENALGIYTYDISEVLSRSLIHDLEESCTGDILYPLKNENPTLKPHLDTVINTCVENDLFEELPIFLKNLYIKLWKRSKDNSKEGKLIAAMDKLEILLFAITEMELGNKSFESIFWTAINILKRDFKDIKTLQDVLSDIQSSKLLKNLKDFL
jgi:5'-deoxynucleotidase YfbR-like HD superfamily hydrolase